MIRCYTSSMTTTTTFDLERAFARHRVELKVYCARMLGSTADAEDAVQDTLVRGWRALRSLRRSFVPEVLAVPHRDERLSRCVASPPAPAASGRRVGRRDRRGRVPRCPGRSRRRARSRRRCRRTRCRPARVRRRARAHPAAAARSRHPARRAAVGSDRSRGAARHDTGRRQQHAPTRALHPGQHARRRHRASAASTTQWWTATSTRSPATTCPSSSRCFATPRSRVLVRRLRAPRAGPT